MRSLALISGLLLAALSVSCRTMNESDLSITGGTAVRSNEKIAAGSVGVLEMNPATIEPFCSGVVIAPDAVLTAAHCFNFKRKLPMIYFGTKVATDITADDTHLMPIAQIVVHPDFDKKAAAAFDKAVANVSDQKDIPELTRPFNDLALLYFTQPLPAGYKVVPVYTKDPAPGLVVHAAGFGCHSTACKEMTNQMRKVDSRWLETFSLGNMAKFAAGSGHGTCPGDSGGPEYVDAGTKLEVLTIVTTGPEDCENGLSIDTLVGPYQGWITETLANLRANTRLK